MAESVAADGAASGSAQTKVDGHGRSDGAVVKRVGAVAAVKNVVFAGANQPVVEGAAKHVFNGGQRVDAGGAASGAARSQIDAHRRGAGAVIDRIAARAAVDAIVAAEARDNIVFFGAG